MFKIYIFSWIILLDQCKHTLNLRIPIYTAINAINVEYNKWSCITVNRISHLIGSESQSLQDLKILVLSGLK